MNETDKIFKELETHLENYLKQEKEELLRYAKKDKKYIAKDLSKRGIGWLSGKLGIDFYKIPGDHRKEYEDKLIHIIQTITVRNIDAKTDEIKDMIEELSRDIRKIIEKETPEMVVQEKTSTPLVFIPHPYPEAPNFTGRKKEREMLTKWLIEDKEHPLLSMVAIGGMGKSALAWRWLQEEVIEKGLELDGVVWWSFYERAANFSSFINETITNLFPEKEEDWRKRSDREKIDLVYQELAKRRFLIVFDGFERTLRAYQGMSACYKGDKCPMDEQSRQCVDPNLGKFLSDLVSENCGSKTLITTRLHPLDIAGSPRVENLILKSMNPEDAVEFFHRQDVKGSPPEIRRYCEKYDYLPLCLRLLSGVIITHHRFKKDRDIKHAEEIPDLKLIKVDDEYHRDAQKFEHILQYSFDELQKANQLLISNIATFRSPMEFSALREILAKNIEVDVFRERLECFKKRGLLIYNKENDTYDLHPVVRRYCYAKLTAPAKTHEKIAEYLESLVGPETTKVEIIEDLQPVIELYHHTIGAGRYYEGAELLRDRLHDPLYFQFGAYQKVTELFEALFVDGLDKPPRLDVDNPKGWVLNNLANAYSLIGQPRRAVPAYNQGIKLAVKLGNKGNLAIALGAVATTCYIRLGDLESAESNLRRGTKIAHEVDDKRVEATGLHEIGRIQSYTARFDESNKELAKSMKLFKKVEHIQGQTVTWAYRSLRALLEAESIEAEEVRKVLAFEIKGRGKPNRASTASKGDSSPTFSPGAFAKRTEALEFATQSFEFAKKDAEESKEPVTRDFIIANWLIGASYVAMKNVEKAEPSLQIAITDCRKINLVESEADILLSIAKLRFLQDKKDESLKLANEALEIANRCGYILQQSDIHLFLAEYYRDLGDFEKAKEQAELAKLRSHQMIDVETGDYITKPEDTKWKYKPCYDKAAKLLVELEARK